MKKLEIKTMPPGPDDSFKVVFVRVAGDLDAAIRLQQSVAQALTVHRFRSKQHPYHPHITIGRVRDEQAQQTIARIANHYQQHFIAPVAVNELILFESSLYPVGAVYSRLATFPLNG